MQAKGIALLVIHHIVAAFKDKLRRDHHWLGVAVPTLDAQLKLSRPQRIAVFASVLLTSMAVNAFFFGSSTCLPSSSRREHYRCSFRTLRRDCVVLSVQSSHEWLLVVVKGVTFVRQRSYLSAVAECCSDPANVADRVITGFLSSLFLVPVQKLFPFMFRQINTFRSYTLVRVEKLKKEYHQKRKQELRARRPTCLSRCGRKWSSKSGRSMLQVCKLRFEPLSCRHANRQVLCEAGFLVLSV